jgi:FkbM family methyltransferase
MSSREGKSGQRLQELISWITKEEVIRLTPVLDRLLVVLMRTLYVGGYYISRFSLRLVLGKKRRDELFIRKEICLITGHRFDFVPIIFISKLLNFVRVFFRKNHCVLLKIAVPRYNYKAYCPANRNDLLNLSIREDEIIEMFCPSEGQIVVDVGAHFGRYTLIASKRVGPTGKVVSIEAHTKNFEMLNKNIKLNKLSNVLSLNYAAYSKADVLKLNLPYEGLSNSIYNTLMSNRFEASKYQEIKADRLDNLLQSNHINLGLVDWIKIDVEGAELEVLKGATSILSQDHNISLLIEIHRLRETTLYIPIKEFLDLYNFKIVFEKIWGGGERHIIAQKRNANA